MAGVAKSLRRIAALSRCADREFDSRREDVARIVRPCVMRFDELPIDILKIVSQKLNYRSLLHVRATSHWLKTTCTELEFFRVLPRAKGASEYLILAALQRAGPKGFSHLNLFNSSLSALAWAEVCTATRDLEELELRLPEPRWNDRFDNHHLRSLLSCERLRRVTLFGNRSPALTDVGLFHCGAAPQALDTLSLQEVAFSCSAVQRFLAMSACCPTTLHINSCPAIRGDFKGMTRLLSCEGRHLTSLMLYSCRVNDTVLNQIATSCPKLEDLDITWHTVGDDAIAALGESCTRLRRLILGESYDPHRQSSESDEDDGREQGCFYSDDGICRLIEARHDTLRELDLTGSFVSNVTLAAMAAHCGTTLSTLNLRLCDGDEENGLHITRRGLQGLLSSCTMLQRVLVGGREWHWNRPNRRLYNLAEEANRGVVFSRLDDDVLKAILPELDLDREWHHKWRWDNQRAA